MAARRRQRGVGFEKCRLDHKRVGAAYRLDQRAGLLGIADDRETGAGPWRPEHVVRFDADPAVERDRLSGGEAGAQRPGGNPERRQPVGPHMPPWRRLEAIAEAVGAAMADWKAA